MSQHEPIDATVRAPSVWGFDAPARPRGTPPPIPVSRPRRPAVPPPFPRARLATSPPLPRAMTPTALPPPLTVLDHGTASSRGSLSDELEVSWFEVTGMEPLLPSRVPSPRRRVWIAGALLAVVVFLLWYAVRS